MNVIFVRALVCLGLALILTGAAPINAEIQQFGPPVVSRVITDEAVATRPQLRTDAEGKTIITLPLSDKIDVEPTLKGRELHLTFTPSVPVFTLPDPGADPLVRNLRFAPDPDPSRVGGLNVSLASEFTSFLLIRRDAASLDVMLKPASEDLRSGPAAAGQSGLPLPSFGREIANIEFTQDSDGSALIKIDGPRDMDFRLTDDKPDAITLLFPEVSVSKALAKLYNLGKFNSAARTAWLQNTAQGVTLTVALSQRVPLSVERRLGRFIFRFPGQSASVNPAPGTAQARPQAGPQARPAAQVQAEPKAGFRKKALKSETAEAEDMLTDYAGQETQYIGEPISIDVQDADVRHVLRLIAQYAGFNLIYDDDVVGRVSLKLANVPWDQVLDIVLRQKSLDKTFKDNVMRIATLTKVRAENEAVTKSIDAEPQVTQSIRLNYIPASQVAPMIGNTCTGVRNPDITCTTVDTFTNSVIITSKPSTIRRWRKICADMDKLEPQVLIEARVVYATDSFERALGLKWGVAQTSLSRASAQGRWVTDSAEIGSGVNLPQVTGRSSTSPFIASAALSKLTGTDLFTLDAQLQLAEYNNLAKTISSPKVVTLNNKPAVVIQGTQIPYTTSSANTGPNTAFKEANLELNVTPQITPDNKFILQIKIKDDSQGKVINGATAIETKSITTSLIANNGETIVIGGVQKQSSTATTDKMPGLGDIPVLGWLFKSELSKLEKVELLVFIRATRLNQ